MFDYPHEGGSNDSLEHSFDNLCESSKLLADGTENIFLLYKEISEVLYLRWKESELKCKRLNIELTKQTDRVRLLENELAQSKSIFDNEVILRRNIEAEFEVLKTEVQSLNFHQALSGHATPPSIRQDDGFPTPVCQASVGASLSNKKSRQSTRSRRPPLRYEDPYYGLSVNDHIKVLKEPRRSSSNELFEHKFIQVTSSKVENCVACCNRIKFVKYRWKCDSCNISIHLECKANMRKCALLCGFPTITRVNKGRPNA